MISNDEWARFTKINKNMGGASREDLQWLINLAAREGATLGATVIEEMRRRGFNPTTIQAKPKSTTKGVKQ